MPWQGMEREEELMETSKWCAGQYSPEPQLLQNLFSWWMVWFKHKMRHQSAYPKYLILLTNLIRINSCKSQGRVVTKGCQKEVHRKNLKANPTLSYVLQICLSVPQVLSLYLGSVNKQWRNSVSRFAFCNTLAVKISQCSDLHISKTWACFQNLT